MIGDGGRERGIRPRVDKLRVPALSSEYLAPSSLPHT